MTGPVVSNTSPLIALEQIGQLSVLHALFERICIPPAVAHEAQPTVPVLPAWIEQHHLDQPLGARVLNASLGAGESEAIGLAMELGARRVLLDERQARRLAVILGLEVTGTLGVLLAAKQRGLLTEIKPWLEALIRHEFRISEALLEQVLRSAGE